MSFTNFGLTFVFIGAAIGIGLTACGIVAGIGSLIFMGATFLALFCGIGGFIAWTGINNMNRERKINENGIAVMGKIFDYVPEYQVRFNNQPTLTVPVGMSALCPYCGRKVRIDASGDVK